MDVDYLLIAKPVAVNHSRIRRDCCVSKLLTPVVGSSHWRSRSLLFRRQGELYLKFVRSGNKAFWSLALRVASKASNCLNASRSCDWNTKIQLWNNENSRPRTWGESFTSIGRIALLSVRGGKHMESSYLVDPASSHMLVSKIKPCMSKYKQICTVKLRMAH